MMRGMYSMLTEFIIASLLKEDNIDDEDIHRQKISE